MFSVKKVSFPVKTAVAGRQIRKHHIFYFFVRGDYD